MLKLRNHDMKVATMQGSIADAIAIALFVEAIDITMTNAAPSGFFNAVVSVAAPVASM